MTHLSSTWYEAKLARARRKQVLLAKGLSHSKTISTNVHIHLLHYSNNCVSDTSVNIIVTTHTSGFHYIITVQVHYKLQIFILIGEPSTKHLLQRKILFVTQINAVPYHVFNHMHNTFYLSTSLNQLFFLPNCVANIF